MLSPTYLMIFFVSNCPRYCGMVDPLNPSSILGWNLSLLCVMVSVWDLLKLRVDCWLWLNCETVGRHSGWSLCEGFSLIYRSFMLWTACWLLLNCETVSNSIFRPNGIWRLLCVNTFVCGHTNRCLVLLKRIAVITFNSCRNIYQIVS